MGEPPDTTPRIYVSAFFCQEIIHEKGDLLTAFRIADTFAAVPIEITPTYEGPDQPVKFPAMTVYPPLSTHALIFFRSEGQVSFTASMKGIGPDGEPVLGGFENMRIDIRGDGAAHVLKANVKVPTEKVGTLWFEISVDGETAMKLSMRIVHPDFRFESGQQTVKLRVDEAPDK